LLYAIAKLELALSGLDPLDRLIALNQMLAERAARRLERALIARIPSGL